MLLPREPHRHKTMHQIMNRVPNRPLTRPKLLQIMLLKFKSKLMQLHRLLELQRKQQKWLQKLLQMLRGRLMTLRMGLLMHETELNRVL